ncbi:hypothetical protein Ahia01_000323400 [Argonauta hians]
MEHYKAAFSFVTSNDFIFCGWRIDKVLGLMIALVTTVSAALLFEALKYESYLPKYIHKKIKSSSFSKICQLNMRIRCQRTILHMLRIATGSFLMLCSMSYNIWIFVSIIVGSAFGYLFLNPVIRFYITTERKRKNPSDTILLADIPQSLNIEE